MCDRLFWSTFRSLQSAKVPRKGDLEDSGWTVVKRWKMIHRLKIKESKTVIVGLRQQRGMKKLEL